MRRLALLLLVSGIASAQLRQVGAHKVDGSDLWNLPHATTLPSTCSVGDIYADSDAPTGARIYLCESANTWIAQGGSGTVTTTGTLASGQVALGSGATSITGDAGLTWTGTGTGFKLFAGYGFLAGDGTVAVPSLGFTSGIGFFSPSANRISVSLAGTEYARFGSNLQLLGKVELGGSITVPAVVISGPSAGTLLVEDGSGNARDVQARTVEAISAYTDGSNYRKLILGNSAYYGAAGLFAEGLGTGINPVLYLGTRGTGEVNFLIAGSTILRLDSTSLYPHANNATDLGYVGTNNWRTGYFGTSVVSPLLVGGGSGLTIGSGGQTLTFVDNLSTALYWVNGALYTYPTNTYDIGLTTNTFRSGYFGTSLISPLLTSGPGKAGTNVAGGNNTIQAEPGTGSATGSSIVFQTPSAGASGTGAQTQTTRLTVSEPAVISAVPVRLAGYTVATLPAGTVGDTAYVTDLTTPTFMATAVGGGAVVGKVFFDGVNWITQ